MRVFLIYPGRLAYGEQPLGILYLSAVLKQAGHETRIWLPSLIDYYSGKFLLSRGSLLRELETFKPHLVGFSVDSPTYFYSLQIAKVVKAHAQVPIIFGGPHPTVDPEATIAHPLVDMILVGEGEEALLELVTKMENGDDIKQVASIWGKSDGQVFRNPVRQLKQDLDSLPFPDRDALDLKIYSQQGLNVLTSRGCPYHCAYCLENYWYELHGRKGKRVRYRDIGKVIEELKMAVEKFNVKLVVFSDETFTAHHNRCLEFCQLYEKEIALPFLCQTRANTVNQELLQALKKAGCAEVHMGIEAGNDYLRNEILERNMSRQTIINAFALAKEANLETLSFNMLGAPFETEQTIWDTINLNREVKPNQVCGTIFTPFKGTKVRILAEKHGWPIDDRIMPDYGHYVIWKLPTISRHKLLSYLLFFESYSTLARKYFPFLNMLRKGSELALWIIPANSQLQRLWLYVMRRLIKMMASLLR